MYAITARRSSVHCLPVDNDMCDAFTKVFVTSAISVL